MASLSRRFILFLVTALPAFLLMERPRRLKVSSLGLAYITRYFEDKVTPTLNTDSKSRLFVKEVKDFSLLK
ncbi:MAG: hypothetical protein A2Y97_10715 [Nitrospirae bacterium RBG_13_39_12]|nr:MAG: hypothetical protein A2Y97_10715 [Nitrospirae bacterium RBG_13_39_12]